MIDFAYLSFFLKICIFLFIPLHPLLLGDYFTQVQIAKSGFIISEVLVNEIPKLRLKSLNFDVLALISLAESWEYRVGYDIVVSKQVLRNQIDRPEESI